MFNLNLTGVFQVMLESNYFFIFFPRSFLCCGIAYVATLPSFRSRELLFVGGMHLLPAMTKRTLFYSFGHCSWRNDH